MRVAYCRNGTGVTFCTLAGHWKNEESGSRCSCLTIAPLGIGAGVWGRAGPGAWIPAEAHAGHFGTIDLGRPKLPLEFLTAGAGHSHISAGQK